jgi:two-component system cell cycle response regulator
MKNANPAVSESLFILQETDEMRHPYENALHSVVNRETQLVWFHSLDGLLESAPKMEPVALIIDLDCLTQPIEPQIEQLRAQFPSSDLVALSSSDSSQLALQCIRSGFVDFLLKPASPEELAYSIRKSQQRREFIQRMEDPRTNVVRAVTQISSCTTPTLARLYTLENLLLLLKAKGAAWLTVDPRSRKLTKFVCTVPRRIESAKVIRKLPFSRIDFKNPRTVISRNSGNGERSVFMPFRGFSEGALFIWGIEEAVGSRTLSSAQLLLEHSELSLLNIQKFDEVKQQTFVDDLTGLYNSRYLKYALTNSVLRCKEPNQRFSVLFIDVDHFKTINDRYSHLVGSEFLVTIGKTIKNAVRRIDPVFRYGGDEFVVILNDTGVEGAKEIGERVRKNIERRIFVIKEHRIQTTVSIGIATYREHANDRDTLLRLADEAMYAAKRETRNAVHLAFGIDENKGNRRTG